MTAVGDMGTYRAPTDMQAAPQQILARVGPGTLSAALVTGISEDTRWVNLRVFPDQQESFVIKGIGFGDDPVNGNFNDPGTPVTASRQAKKESTITEPRR